MYDKKELSKRLVPELRDLAKTLGIPKADYLKKQELIDKILKTTEANDAPQKEAASKSNVVEEPKDAPKPVFEIPDPPVRNREKRHRLVLKNKPVASVSISNGTQSYQNEKLTQQQTQQVPQSQQQPQSLTVPDGWRR